MIKTKIVLSTTFIYNYLRMKSALIGYTGFVGSNLATQNKFDDLYNSKNIQDIDGKSYDLVVCAGARAEKWRINQEADKDLAEIQMLIDHLKTINAKKLVLISTTDVYKNPVNVDEDDSIDTTGLHPYGLNRYYLEQFCHDNFDVLIIRLPGLFGPGLKKNVIYDLLNNNNVDCIHYAGSYQYYNLEHIWQDIQVALKHNLHLLNLATEPIRTDEIAKHCFSIKNFKNQPKDQTAGSYDMHSKHAKIYSGNTSYMYNKRQVLDEIKQYVISAQRDLDK